MQYGARNNIRVTVRSVQSDPVMSLVKFETLGPVPLASVLTTESVREMNLRVGDEVHLVIKAVHVLPVKE